MELWKDRDKSFRYQMLSRLQMDCNYYLGNGTRYVGHLWAGTVEKHIEEMKKGWNSFAEDEKPEWLTWENILNYEKEMKKAIVETTDVNGYMYRIVFESGRIQYCEMLDDVYKVLVHYGLTEDDGRRLV